MFIFAWPENAFPAIISKKNSVTPTLTPDQIVAMWNEIDPSTPRAPGATAYCTLRLITGSIGGIGGGLGASPVAGGRGGWGGTGARGIARWRGRSRGWIRRVVLHGDDLSSLICRGYPAVLGGYRNRRVQSTTLSTGPEMDRWPGRPAPRRLPVPHRRFLPARLARSVG